MAFELKFLPEDKSFTLNTATPLSDAAAQLDILIDHPCGSKATCGNCRVRFIKGAPHPTETERRLLQEEQLAAGWRLACQCVVNGNATVEVPAVSRAASAKSFGTEDLFASDFERRVELHDVVLPPATIERQLATEESLCGQIGRRVCLQPDEMRWLTEIAQNGNGAVRLLRDGEQVLAICPTSERIRPPMGVAIDIGSTTLAAALVDMTSGKVIAQQSSLNPQVRYGADVISRIDYAIQNPDGIAKLHEALLSELTRMIAVLHREGKIDLLQIWSVCVAGNPAMLHTFMGIDPRGLAISPYVGVWTRGLDVAVKDVGTHRARLGDRKTVTADLSIRKEAHVRVMPMIRSNVGGDTVAALVASGMDQMEKPSILIDLGTNCEVVIGNRDRLIATSTAAGPAFEGANISQGMRAAPGAIDRVSLVDDGMLQIHVLGGGKAKGVCGSGLIDAVSVLLRTGAIDPSGRLHTRERVDGKRYPHIARRIVHGEVGQVGVVLAFPEQSENEVPVILTAHDVRQLQLIKGSIRAGCRFLMDRFGVAENDLGQIMVAGAFGCFVRKESLIDIGLLPQVDPEKIHFIGNAAGVGAHMALVDQAAWRRAEAIHGRAEYVELGGAPGYQEVFAEAMGFHDSPAIG